MLRKKFSKEQHRWSEEDIKQIVFSDESRFEIFHKTKIRVRRPQNLKLHPKYTEKVSEKQIVQYLIWTV